MNNTQSNMNKIPDNYRVSRDIGDFSVNSVVYWKKDKEIEKGVVCWIGKLHDCVYINWEDASDLNHHTQKTFGFIYVQDKEQCTFNVGDIVEYTPTKRKGEVTVAQKDFIWVLLEGNPEPYPYRFSIESQNLKLITAAPTPKEITVDLKLTLDFSTEGIRTVIMDCVLAVLKQDKSRTSPTGVGLSYQEAKELCALLISLKGIEKGKSKDALTDALTDTAQA